MCAHVRRMIFARTRTSSDRYVDPSSQASSTPLSWAWIRFGDWHKGGMSGNETVMDGKELAALVCARWEPRPGEWEDRYGCNNM